jgi:AP2-like factor, ANT lineage
MLNEVGMKSRFFFVDWSMRGSELSALVAEPKLEDFLGGISAFSEQNHKASYNMIPSSSSACYANSGVTTEYQPYHQPSSALQFADSVMVASSAGVHDGSGMLSAATANGGAAAAASSNNGGSIGLSMIKNWLRSQPAPPQPRLDAADGARASQGLSLSMNMAGTRGAGMPLAGERGRAPESVSTTASVQGGTMAARKEDTIGGSGGAGALIPVSTDTGGCGASADAVARKTVDTFGQRTSIYRGVTR